MDVLNPSVRRKSVAVMPTSTSYGADACLAAGIDVPKKGDPDYEKKLKAAVKKLRDYKVYGLPESVSQYAFARCLEKLGEKESDYQFAQMQPDKAALAMQAKDKNIKAIMVWNPFVLQTLKTRKDVKVVFDSSMIPEEIIDMVVVGKDVLDKPKGKEFACAVIETYYRFNQMLWPKGGEGKKDSDLLVALGEKFSSLDRDAMDTATEQTRFYRTPELGISLFTDKGMFYDKHKRKFPDTMKMVLDFYVKHKIIKGDPPKIGYGNAEKAGDVNLRFDPSYMETVKEKMGGGKK
jgi:NitT/TauT family transport system substrate-binding protein